MTTLEGKICLVTGATSGIGKEIARGLSKLGATVVLVGRNKNKCESTLRDLSASLDQGNESKISYLVADLCSQTSIRQLAKDFANAHQRLDVLINNAGVFLAKQAKTIDGIEYTFAINHLAHFLLTNLLIGTIKVSSPSRIITTSSIAHRGVQIDFDDIQFEKRTFSGLKAYGQSKLANILFTKELARRLDGTGVTANCFHPGAVRTNLVQENPWYYRLIWAAAGAFLLNPEKGADTAIFLASSPSVEGITGKYFVKRKPVNSSEQAEDEDAAGRLWEISERLTGTKN